MRLRLVVLDDFFMNSEKKSAKKYFNMLVGMKKKGYWSKHNSSYLPFDQDDFICTHVLFVDEVLDEIVLAYKLIRKMKCEEYSVSFAMDNYLRSQNVFKARPINDLLNEFATQGYNIAYSGGWTVNPKYKGNGDMSLFKDMYTGTHYLVNDLLGIDTFMGIGVLNFKTHLFFQEEWGAVEMGPQIFNFSSCDYLDCKFYYQHMNKVADNKIIQAKKYQGFFDDKILIIGNTEEKLKKAS